MDKIKWKYDSKNKYWWVNETVPYANDGMQINKSGKTYRLSSDHFKVIGRFKKLSSAKTVANLLRHG